MTEAAHIVWQKQHTADRSSTQQTETTHYDRSSTQYTLCCVVCVYVCLGLM